MKRELKRATWIFNEEDNTFTLKTTAGLEISGEITIDRVYAFSLIRFLLRGIYRMTMRKRRIKVADQEESPDETLIS